MSDDWSSDCIDVHIRGNTAIADHRHSLIVKRTYMCLIVIHDPHDREIKYGVRNTYVSYSAARAG